LTHRGAVVCWPDVIGVQFADGSVDINKSYPQNGIYYRPHNRRDERPFALPAAIDPPSKHSRYRTY